MVVTIVLSVAGLLPTQGAGEAAVAAPSGRVLTGVTVDGERGVIPELDAYQGSAGGKAPVVVMDYRDWAHTPDFPSDFANIAASRGATPICSPGSPGTTPPG